MSKLQKSAPDWHAKAVADVMSDLAETNELSETARRRRARVGLKLIWIKAMGKEDGSIPHGEFGPFLKKHFPGTPPGTLGDYITEGRSILDLLRWQISEIPKFETPPHLLLGAKADALSGVEKERQKKLAEIIEQQKHIRAVTEYKQVELKDDATVPKRGRLKGSDGNPKEKRMAHKLKLHELSMLEKLTAMRDFGAACDTLCDPLLMAPDLKEARQHLFKQVKNLFLFFVNNDPDCKAR